MEMFGVVFFNLDYNEDFTGIYIFQYSSNCILLTCEIYYDNYSPINKAIFILKK